MTATYTGSAKDYKYVWYRSINGGAFELQTPVQYTGTDGTALGSDIKDDGTELYISLNGGALTSANTNVQYKVAVYAADAFDKDGDLKEDATLLAESIAKSGLMQKAQILRSLQRRQRTQQERSPKAT